LLQRVLEDATQAYRNNEDATENHHEKCRVDGGQTADAVGSHLLG
jgi:hypothetical protein